MDRWLYGWAIGYVSVGAASLLIPLYALSLGGGPLLIGVLASTAAFAGVPGAILWGRLASRTQRRRPFVLVALGLTAIVLFLTPFIETARTLVVANSALWFVVSAAAPVLNLIVVANAPDEEWESRIGRLNTYQGYGWVGGLALGTVWTALVPEFIGPVRAQESLFVLLSVLALGGLGIVRLWYPESVTVSIAGFRRVYRRLGLGTTTGRVMRSVPLGLGRAYWALTNVRRHRIGGFRAQLWRYLGAVGVFSIGFAMFWGLMPVYLTDVGFTAATVFLLFLIANAGSAASYDRIGILSARFGPDRIQIGALGGRVVLFPGVGLIVGITVDAYVLAILFFLIGVTWAVIAVTVTGTVVRLTTATNRAEGLGFHTAAVGIGTGVGSVLGGAVASAVSYTGVFVIAAAFVLVGTGAVVASLAPRDW
jgi:MFS family permease